MVINFLSNRNLISVSNKDGKYFFTYNVVLHKTFLQGINFQLLEKVISSLK